MGHGALGARNTEAVKVLELAGTVVMVQESGGLPVPLERLPEIVASCVNIYRAQHPAGPPLAQAAPRPRQAKAAAKTKAGPQPSPPPSALANLMHHKCSGWMRLTIWQRPLPPNMTLDLPHQELASPMRPSFSRAGARASASGRCTTIARIVWTGSLAKRHSSQKPSGLPTLRPASMT